MRLRSKALSLIWKITSLVLIVILAACSNESVSISTRSSKDIPDEEADSVKVVYTNNEKIEYQLNAVKIKKYKKNRKTFADTVNIIIYDTEMNIQSTLYSDKAEVNDIDNIIIAEGNVVVTSDNGILKTPFLIWNRNSDKLFAKNGVEIIRNNNTLIGEELKTDMKMERLEIKKVSAEGTLDEEIIDW